MIAIVDYGVGNLRSVEKAFHRVGCDARVTAEPGPIKSATGVVLPGVGAFGAAMEHLQASGLEGAVRDAVAREVPFLGICVGLQLLFETSEELYKGAAPRGLGLMPGNVRRFPDGRKVPQIGWNQLDIRKRSPLLEGVDDGAFVYFVHSYYAEPTDAAHTVASTAYGIEYASVVGSGRLFAVQFHPEKSSRVGLQILKNFGAMCQ